MLLAVQYYLVRDSGVTWGRLVVVGGKKEAAEDGLLAKVGGVGVGLDAVREGGEVEGGGNGRGGRVLSGGEAEPVGEFGTFGGVSQAVDLWLDDGEEVSDGDKGAGEEVFHDAERDRAKHTAFEGVGVLVGLGVGAGEKSVSRLQGVGGDLEGVETGAVNGTRNLFEAGGR